MSNTIKSLMTAIAVFVFAPVMAAENRVSVDTDSFAPRIF